MVEKSKSKRSAARRRNRPYGLLARFNDEIVPGVAAMNRHAREKILAPHWSRIERVVELACGNGATAVDLAKKGLDVLAIDWSPTFVAAARRRAREELARGRRRGRVRFERGDMRRFRVAEPADLVLCEFAALNNLARRDDLAPTLRCFARALKPGGLLLFDVNSPLAFETQTPAEPIRFTGKRFEVAMKGAYDRRSRVARLDFAWSLRSNARARSAGGARAARPVVERIWHVAWSAAEICRALRAAGFTSIELFDGVDVRPRMKGARRGTDLYFLARRGATELATAVKSALDAQRK